MSSSVEYAEVINFDFTETEGQKLTKIPSLKYDKLPRKSPMTCIIGGKCNDGVVIMGDTKVTYDNKPPTYKEKIYSDYYPVVTAYAGSEILYKEFKSTALSELQIKDNHKLNLILKFQESFICIPALMI